MRSVFFRIVLIRNGATWDKVQSTSFNFCCLMMAAGKTQLLKIGTNILPKLFSSLLLNFGQAFIYQQTRYASTDNSMKQQE